MELREADTTFWFIDDAYSQCLCLDYTQIGPFCILVFYIRTFKLISTVVEVFETLMDVSIAQNSAMELSQCAA